MDEIIKKTKTGYKVVAERNYAPHVNLLAKMTDTGNGYIFKFPSYSSMGQTNYICMDYAEADYIVKILMQAYKNNPTTKG